MVLYKEASKYWIDDCINPETSKIKKLYIEDFKYKILQNNMIMFLSFLCKNNLKLIIKILKSISHNKNDGD